MSDARFTPEEVARFENATWSRCARGYVDGFGRLVAEAVEPLLDEAGAGVGGRVLDVGTGPGLVAGALAARGAQAVGVDFSEAMIEVARARNPELELHVAAAEAVPFEDGGFDAVVGNFVLHHSGAPDALLREARRVLRDGGRAAFTVWGDVERLEAFGLFFAAVAEHAGAAELPHGPLFGVSAPAALEELLAAAGFRDCTARELPLAWRTPSIESYLSAFADWADLDALPSATRAAIEATVRAGAERYRASAGFVLPNPAVLVAGTK